MIHHPHCHCFHPFRMLSFWNFGVLFHQKSKSSLYLCSRAIFPSPSCLFHWNVLAKWYPALPYQYSFLPFSSHQLQESYVAPPCSLSRDPSIPQSQLLHCQILTPKKTKFVRQHTTLWSFLHTPLLGSLILQFP